MLLHLILKIFGVDPVFLRLPTLLAGIASIILSYTISYKFTKNQLISIGVTLLVAISSSHIYYSANARGYILIIFFSQCVVYWMLSIYKKTNSNDFTEPEFPAGVTKLIVLLLIFVMGTWTIPTFAMIQGSLLFFLAIHLVTRKLNGHPILKSVSVQVILIILLSLIIFYYQYFVLIPREVLLLSTTRAPITLSDHFVQEIFAKLFHPYNSATPILIGLMAFGMFCSFKKSKMATLFLIVIFLLPAIFLLAIFHAGIADNLPTPRVFLYLQPIAYLFVAIGLYSIILFFSNYFLILVQKQRAKLIIPNIILFLFFLLAGIPSAKILSQVDFPERTQREPFDSIHQFIKQSGPNDLFMASSQIHVEIFLYGAKEIRKKVDTIIESGTLNDIYLIGSTIEGKSDIEIIKEEGKTYYSLKNYQQIKAISNVFNWKISTELMDEVFREGNLIIYKIPARRVRKLFSLTTSLDLEEWQYRGKANAIEVSQIKIGTQSPWTLTFKKNASLFSPPTNITSNQILTIKFMVTQNTKELRFGYFNTELNYTKSTYKPTWVVNSWFLDHPYSPKIYDHPWFPWIFISDSAPKREAIISQIPKNELPQTIWGLQSFVIE